MSASYFAVMASTESNATAVVVGDNKDVLVLIVFIIAVSASIALGYTMYQEKRAGK